MPKSFRLYLTNLGRGIRCPYTCTIKNHASKTYGRVAVLLHAFLTSTYVTSGIEELTLLRETISMTMQLGLATPDFLRALGRCLPVNCNEWRSLHDETTQINSYTVTKCRHVPLWQIDFTKKIFNTTEGADSRLINSFTYSGYYRY